MYKSSYFITWRHYLALGVIAFAAGIFIATSFMPVTFIHLMVSFSTILGVLGIAIIIKIYLGAERIKHLLLPFFLILCCLSGSFRIVSQELFNPSPLKPHLNSQVWLTGTVVSVPSLSKNSRMYSFQFEAAQINDRNIIPEDIIIRIPESRGKNLKSGDKICCWTEITEAHRETVLDNYDYYTYLRGKNIFYTGNTQNTNPAEFEKPFTFLGAVKDIGRYANTKLCSSADRLFANQPQLSALLKGILVGDKSGFSDELYQEFSFSGLSHIVSVSGMHLSIFYMAITRLFRTLRIRKRYAIIITIPLLLVFTSTAAFTPSVCRASLMYLMAFTAYLLNLRYPPANSLFLSIGVILFFSPYALYSRSLALSFCAVLGIYLFGEYLTARLNSHLPFSNCRKYSLKALARNSLRTILGSFSITTSACLGTLFFTYLFFGRIPYIQFLTNLWVIPLVAIVFVLGYAACIVIHIFPPVATFLSYPLSWFLQIILATAHTFGKEKFTFNLPQSIQPLTVFVLYSGIVLTVYLALKAWYDSRTLK